MDKPAMNQMDEVTPQGLPVLEEQLESLLRNPNALRNDPLYGKHWCDAENEAHSWVNREYKAVSQHLAAHGLRSSGRTDRRVILEIPFEGAEKRVLGFLEARRLVLSRLQEIRAELDMSRSPSERTQRHQREISRFERILRTNGRGVGRTENDEEYGPVLCSIEEAYRAVAASVRNNATKLGAGANVSKHEDFVNALLRDADDSYRTYRGKANVELLREVQSRLEHEQSRLSQSVTPPSPQPVNRFEQLKGFLLRYWILAVVFLLFLVIIALDQFLDAFEGMTTRVLDLFGSVESGASTTTPIGGP
jgi:hypothetical protein